MAEQSEEYKLGLALGRFVKEQGQRHPAQLTAVIADLSADHPDLQAPLRDLVTRESFLSLLHKARSGGGLIQRDAVIQEMKSIYQQDILANLEEVLNGFLDISKSITPSLSPTVNSIQASELPLQVNANLAGHSAVTVASPASSHYGPRQSSSLKIISSASGIAVAAIAVVAFFVSVHTQTVVPISDGNPSQEIGPSEDSQLNELADEIFWRRHPSLKGKKLTQQNGDLAREWLKIRECEAIVDYKFYKIYPYMKGRLIKENQVEMASRWKNLYDNTPGCT